MSYRLFTVLFSMLPFCVFAQKKAVNVPDYPQGYFRNPLDIPIFLAGNFGECRPGHFHSGIDIKTQGAENKVVHAAADGYISRIKMEKGGFGHGLYITHPNGYTTLYAHLNDFAPAIQKYVREKQYEKQRWDVDLQLSPSQFPVKKGQQIAWSGNTGASTAPHLHFEIRNTKTEHPLNPQLFGLSIIDTKPPVPAELAIYDMSRSVYEQSPFMAPLKKSGEHYSFKTNSQRMMSLNGGIVKGDTIALFPSGIGIGINVDDYMDGSDNTIAFLTAQLTLDDSLQTEIKLDNIGYDVTRYVNAYADYDKHTENGHWIQCLFKLPGNKLDNIYTYLNSQNGSVNIQDNNIHKVQIRITDDKNNSSNIVCYVRKTRFTPPVIKPFADIKFYANRSNQFSDSGISFTLDERQLYDDINFVFSRKPTENMFSDRFQLHYPYVPLHHYFDLTLKPNKQIPAELKNKIVLRYTDGKEESGDAAISVGDGWYKASERNFGTYWLEVDTAAPTIRSMQKNGANLSRAKQITFEVKDAMTSVRTFSGHLDGKWICFEQHGNSFFYKFDGHCSKGKHELMFKAADENGNERQQRLTFTR